MGRGRKEEMREGRGEEGEGREKEERRESALPKKNRSRAPAVIQRRQLFAKILRPKYGQSIS